MSIFPAYTCDVLIISNTLKNYFFTFSEYVSYLPYKQYASF